MSSPSDREDLLRRISNGLAEHVITPEDLTQFTPVIPKVAADAIQSQEHPQASQSAVRGANRLSIIDVLFYIAGIIMYAALMVLAFQSGDSTASVLTTLVPGLLLWTVVYALARKPDATDNRRGLSDALLLAGSLAVISGGVTMAMQVVDSDSPNQAYAVTVALLVLAVAHLAFDKLLRHIVLIVFGTILAVVAFPTLFVAILSNFDNQLPDVWVAISIGTGVLLAYGGRLAARTLPDRMSLQTAFDSCAAFIILGSIYAGGLVSESLGILWQLLLPLMIYAAFFVSIKRRSKNFLFTGSIFLVLFLITITFKYFSGAGAAVSLMFSAISILATAFMALSINKRYLKQ